MSYNYGLPPPSRYGTPPNRYGVPSNSYGTPPGRYATSPNNFWKTPGLYKTRLCDYYVRNQTCKFGNRCWYAHSMREMRLVPHLDSNPVAKTLASMEVVSMLDPNSRDHKVAMKHAGTLLNDTAFFENFTIPYLNSMALRDAAQQDLPNNENQFASMQDLILPPMQGSRLTSPPFQGSRPNQQYYNTIRSSQAGLPMDTYASNFVSAERYPSINGHVRPPSVSVLSTSRGTIADDQENSEVFDSIKESFDVQCSTYFV